ncbi:MAG TPA: NADP-binding protein [Clostridiaceae bacterium]|nr:NADP-binding protein [Clostridiaceae bacterium]
MRDIRVALWGFGAMGSGIAKMIASKEGLAISGVCVRREHLVGQEVYAYLGIDRGDCDPVIITNKIENIVRRDLCDIVILATDSFVEAQFDKIMFCLDRGVHVITMAEEMAWPWAQNEELADKIDALARKRGVAVLGTGINPGFVLDYLILALSGTCEHVESISAARINDLAPFGKSVMVEQGVGISVEEFDRRKAEGSLAGHVGFPESMAMIAAGMGVELTDIEQTRDPIITNVDRESAYGEAKKGHLAGIRQQSYGRVADGKVFIHLDHPQQICPEDEGVNTGDYVTIRANGYDMNLSIVPETPGGIGTIAMVVNMIPHVLGAKPGLRSMLDLPVPRCILGNYAEQVHRTRDRQFLRGELVSIESVILPVGERAPQVPDDTQRTPLRVFTKGFLQEESARRGDTVTVKTMSDRLVEGTLTNRSVSPTHTFGDYVPELMTVHRQVFDILFGGAGK